MLIGSKFDKRQRRKIFVGSFSNISFKVQRTDILMIFRCAAP